MRKWNCVISGAILLLFLVHAVTGAYQMTGWMSGGTWLLKYLAWGMLGLVILHIGLGIKLTFDTLRSYRKTGVFYWKENLWFLARRISGFALIFLLAYHAVLFMGENGTYFRLHLFEGPQLAGSLLFAAALAVHLLSNIRPWLIGLGKGWLREYAADIIFILSVLLAVAAAAFVIYYFRWNLIWKR